MSNFSRFYALLKQLPHADKEMLVETYSDGKTTSLREFMKLNPKGFANMLNEMQGLVDASLPQPLQKRGDAKVDEPQKRRYRSLVLRAMQDQGVTVVNKDWSAVNDFVERYAGAGKSLSNMSLDELKKFNAQVHKLLDWHNAKKESCLRIAIMN